MALLTRLGVAFTVVLALLLIFSVVVLAVQQWRRRRQQRQRHSRLSPYSIEEDTNASSLSVNSPGAGKAWLLPVSTRDITGTVDKTDASSDCLSLEPCSTRSTLVASESCRSSVFLEKKSSPRQTWKKVVTEKVRALLSPRRATRPEVPEIRITFPDELIEDDEQTLYYASLSEADNQQKVKGSSGRAPRMVIVQMSESGSGAAFVRDVVEPDHAEINNMTGRHHLENFDPQTIGRLREK
ncbi:hypothetical protein V1525DRAFT_395336 [Lipomyces kononenkoae]|uniref:Uncharacterized protein n=1 Tax=Lipomyces kononenkoae TaxID=34357 RepID=A0ACC3T9E1_LIPKO